MDRSTAPTVPLALRPMRTPPHMSPALLPRNKQENQLLVRKHRTNQSPETGRQEPAAGFEKDIYLSHSKARKQKPEKGHKVEWKDHEVLPLLADDDPP